MVRNLLSCLRPASGEFGSLLIKLNVYFFLLPFESWLSINEQKANNEKING